MDCIFCKIIAGEIPSKKVFENDDVIAMHDIAPKAKFHVIIMPKQHIVSAADISEDNSFIVGKIFEAAAKIALENGLKDGFRVVTNCGIHGSQTVSHLHFHLLGGEQLSEGMC